MTVRHPELTCLLLHPLRLLKEEHFVASTEALPVARGVHLWFPAEPQFLKQPKPLVVRLGPPMVPRELSTFLKQCLQMWDSVGSSVALPDLLWPFWGSSTHLSASRFVAAWVPPFVSPVEVTTAIERD